MKLRYVAVVLIIIALVLPLCFIRFTGVWMMDVVFPKGYGSTITACSAGGYSIWYLVGEAHARYSATYREFKNKDGHKFTCKDLIWVWDGRWEVELKQPPWTSYSTALSPGDLTNPLKNPFPPLTELEKWWTMPRMYSWDEVKRWATGVFGDWDTLVSRLRARMENVTFTAFGVTTVPFTFTFVSDREFKFPYPLIVKVAGFIKLDVEKEPHVAPILGLVDGPKEVRILGVLGEEKLLEKFDWGPKLPFTSTDLLEKAFKTTIFTKLYEPTVASVDVKKEFGIPTGLKAWIWGMDVKVEFITGVSSYDPSVLNYEITVEVKRVLQYPHIIKFDVYIPVCWAVKIVKNLDLPDIPTLPLIPLIPENLPFFENFIKIEWDKLFENFTIVENPEWKDFIKSLEENMTEFKRQWAIDPKIDFILREPLPALPVIPVEPLNPSVVSYVSGPYIPMNYVGEPTTPVTPERPFIGPYILDVAVILVALLIIVGALIWAKL